jgi:hypothetical protein
MVDKPTLETLSLIAIDRDLDIPPEQIEAVVNGLRGMRPKLQMLRAIPLSYLPPVVEPATALAWIRRGGRDE